MAKTAKAKKSAAAGKKKGTLEIFDPFGPGFRVFHKEGGSSTHVGGSAALAGDTQTGDKLTLEIFDPFGKGFRVVRRDGD